MDPIGIRCVVPSRVAVEQPFSIKTELLGPNWKSECSGHAYDRKPALHGPFNLNVSRRIRYHDSCLPEWSGRLAVDAGPELAGSRELVF